MDRIEPGVQVVVKNGQLQFKLNSAELTDDDKVILDEVASNLQRLKFVSGTVTGLGHGVTNLKEGDHVLVAAVTSCGACEACREGRENVCAHGEMMGNNIDGGFAEYVVAPAKDTFVLPDEVPLVEGSGARVYLRVGLPF